MFSDFINLFWVVNGAQAYFNADHGVTAVSDDAQLIVTPPN